MLMAIGQYGFTIAVYLISIMVAVAGISLGLGYAFNEKRLKDFGRKELFECVLNGVIVGTLFTLFYTNGPVAILINQLTLTNSTTLSCSAFMSNNTAICLSYDYLVSPLPYTFMGTTHYSVLSSVSETIAELTVLNGILGLIAAIKINLILVSFSPSYVFAPLISQISYIIRILSTIAISAVVQAAVLQFVAIGALTILLPSGIILRTFYPTRKLGGFLMAAAIGLYVVLPLSYVFNATLANSYNSAVNQTSLQQVSLSASNIKDTLLDTAGTNQTSGAGSSYDGLIGSIESTITGFTNYIATLINSLLSQLAYFIVYAFILPVFSLIMTGISIRELAELLGSEAFFGKFDIL
jgi:hypothetical protein